MDLSLGNIYPIPENPAEEEPSDRQYSETSFCADKKIIKKISSSSLPEKQENKLKIDLQRKDNSIPILITTEQKDQKFKIVFSGDNAFPRDYNRLSVSLFDLSNFSLAENSKTVEPDKQKALSPMKFPHMISEKNSKSYLNIQDRTTYSNDEPVYETLLSPTVISHVNLNQKRNSTTRSKCQRKESDSFVFIDLNSEDDVYQTIGNPAAPNACRQRASSMQWIQSTFQNVTNKYKDLLEFRRPSDIVEDRMRKSKEGLDMEDSETEITDINQNPSVSSRRFSENVIGKQKRFPFVGRLHLKGFWKDRGNKRQEEKDSDQTRSDVCPLFSIPRKQNEDELILDTLRQAMRKCTAVDPNSRPTSTLVFEQLSNLLRDR